MKKIKIKYCEPESEAEITAGELNPGEYFEFSNQSKVVALCLQRRLPKDEPHDRVYHTLDHATVPWVEVAPSSIGRVNFALSRCLVRRLKVVAIDVEL